MKKNLANTLKDRTDTIEYRAIRKHLMNAAQNGKAEYRLLSISDKTIIQLQNQGINIDTIEEHGFKKYKLTW